MNIPFKTNKRIRNYTKTNWKKGGLSLENDLAFHVIYKRYIFADKCEHCNAKFKNSTQRHMDHEHSTGKFRNVLCSRCNHKRFDVSLRKDSQTGHRHIIKKACKFSKQGFYYVFKINEDGRRITLKSSIHLDKLVAYRDKWYAENPDYFC